ncbi:MAG: MGMT family protein [Myxococcota bacterium]
MAKSIAFAGIKADVRAIVASIPKGRVTTYGAIGDHMTVMPRHVAYILATLDDSDANALPWYRVVGTEGRLGKKRTGPSGASQQSLLEDEGVTIDKKVVVEFDRVFVEPAKLKSGVRGGKTYG